jgi:hypothetical protein
MSSRFESMVDRQIREARERGAFDDLPGAGKPLPGRGESYDENWWIKDWLRRENITGVLPTSLRVRKEADEILDALAKVPSEAKVREILADLNARIDLTRRGLVDGPPVLAHALNVEETAEAWRRRRSGR